MRSQITSFCETIAKVLDKDTSLAEKIRTLFREQGITIASILTAIGMAIGALVEALLPDGGGGAKTSGGEPPPKDERGSTLPFPRLLVPTPFTKGVEPTPPPQLSQKPLPL